MKEYDFIQMIRRIKKLPDNLLIQILIAICHELDHRTKTGIKIIRQAWERGDRDGRNTHKD